MLRTESIAKKMGKVQFSDPGKFCLTLHAMLRSFLAWRPLLALEGGRITLYVQNNL